MPIRRPQFRKLFQHLRQYLLAAGASFDSIVEITTYHVNLREHLDAFTAVKDAYLVKPYPAWSAIGGIGTHHQRALVELRAIAEHPEIADQPSLRART
ncbi:MAG: Rid family hydrolase [Geodermatophilaceae bacterium]